MVCIAYGVAIERRAYRLVRRGLAILPADGPESVTVLHLSDLHFVSGDRRKRAFLASIPRADVTVVTGDFLAEPEAVETAVDAVRETRGRLASWFVLGSNDYYVPHAIEPAPVLHPDPPAEASSGSARPVGRAARAPVRGRLAGPHQPARGARARRAGDRAPGSGRHAHPSPGPAGRAQARAVEVRDRRDALTGLGARDRRVRLPVRRRGTHARRSGPAAARGRPRHELASAPAPGVRADPDGWVVRARVAGTGDEQVRAVPVPVPARGDAAGAAPGPRRRGPGAVSMLSRSRGSSARCRSRATAARSRGGCPGGHAAGRGDPGCRWPS